MLNFKSKRRAGKLMQSNRIYSLLDPIESANQSVSREMKVYGVSSCVLLIQVVPNRD